jgi:hypothetical protein
MVAQIAARGRSESLGARHRVRQVEMRIGGEPEYRIRKRVPLSSPVERG